MTFFIDQERARKNTSLLLILYALTIVLIVISIYLGLLLFFYQAPEFSEFSPGTEFSLWHADFFYAVAAIVGGVILLGTACRVIQLARGGVAVALSVGGRLIQADSENIHERRILNVVEEIAIASGVSIPPVYVMDNEQGINAFAAGYRPNAAVIGVSQGCITCLSRDELQGVIAHEFSHILNGDMRLNIRLMSILYGILMLTLIGRMLIRAGWHSNHRRRDNEQSLSGGIAVAGFVFLLIGSIGALGAKLIKMAVSRQREFLADASAVQFTRNPAGIAGALMKIGGLQEGSSLRNPAAEDVSHLCFANPLAGFFSRLALFSTHPPLKERIRRLKPDFDGNFPVVEHVQIEETPETDHSRKEDRTQADVLFPAAGAILGSVGSLSPRAIASSHALLESIPQSLRKAAGTPLDAGAIYCALLLAADPAIQAAQLERTRYELPDGMFDLMLQFAKQVSHLPTAARLALVDLSLEGLRNLSKSQYVRLRVAIDSVIHADAEVTLFEYCALHSLTRPLDEQFGLKKTAHREERNLARLVTPASHLLFALATLGNRDQDAAVAAYTAACNELGIAPELRLPISEAHSVTTSFLDTAIEPLESIAPLVREKIFNACISCIQQDDSVNENELLLIRAIGSILECPVPLAF